MTAGWFRNVPPEESRAAMLSLGVGALLMAVKFVAYFLTGSAAIFSDAVESIVNVDPSYSKADYERLFGQPVAGLPPTLQQALSLTTGQHLTVLYVVTNKQYTSDEARSLVRAVRGEHIPDGQVLATGATAFDLDIVDFVLSKTPTANYSGR